MLTFRDHLKLSKTWLRSAFISPKEKIFFAILAWCWFFPEFYGHQLYMGAAAVAAAFICYSPYRLSLKCLVIYHVVATCGLLAFRDFYKPDIQMNMDLALNRALLFELVLVLAVFLFFRISTTVFGLVAVVGSILTLCGSGLTYVTTMNTAALAVLLPFVPPIFLPLTLVAIVIHKGALSYGLVVLHLLYFGCYYRNRIYLGGFAISLALGVLHLGDSILDASRARFNAIVFHEWASSHWLIGSGLGSFQILGPMLQNQNKIDPGRYWMSLHNEWIQALLETGAVGLLLLLWVWLDFLWKNRKEPILFSSMLALGVCGVAYFPFKIPLLILVFGVLVAEGLRKPIVLKGSLN